MPQLGRVDGGRCPAGGSPRRPPEGALVAEAARGAGRGGVRAGLRDANAAPRVERRRAETLAPLRKIEMYLRLFHLLPHFFMFRHSSRHSKTLFFMMRLLLFFFFST